MGTYETDHEEVHKVTSEHILVCLSPAPSNARIIQTAAKMAEAFGGALTALYVKTPATEKLSEENLQRLQRNLRLAEQLGATITTVNGEDVPYQIAEFARLSGVTKVVIGRSNMSGGHFWKRTALTEQLVNLAPNLDIYIIPDSTGENAYQKSSFFLQPVLPTIRDWVLTVVILAAATAIGCLFGSFRFTESNIITVYILGALITALLTKSYFCSAASSLASVFLFSFFFTEPKMMIHAYEAGYWVTFLIMLIASLVTGGLANKLAVHARQSAEAAFRTKVLFDTNQLLQKVSEDEEFLRITENQLAKLLSRDLIIYPVIEEGLGDGVQIISGPEKGDNCFEAEKHIAGWVYRNKKRAGTGTGTFGNAKGLYLAIRSSEAVYGVVGIHIGDKPLEPFETSVLLSILGECAMAMENGRNAREKEQAAVLAKNEQLRANLLRAISHDLRTPLTSISGNAENLLANDSFMDGEGRKQVLTDIYEDSIWLIQLVENLLSITRIGEGRMHLNMSDQLVDEVVTEALRHVSRKGSDHVIKAEFKDEWVLARMDARLISQVIINLVDNAIKYTPAGSHITVTAERISPMAVIKVADNGPGIADNVKPKVFEMFFTGENQVADCRRSLGLGLALCRSIVHAHGGEIALTDNQPRGAVFTFTIPESEVTLNE